MPDSQPVHAEKEFPRNAGNFYWRMTDRKADKHRVSLFKRLISSVPINDSKNPYGRLRGNRNFFSPEVKGVKPY
jgi:hypothetical protein